MAIATRWCLFRHFQPSCLAPRQFERQVFRLVSANLCLERYRGQRGLGGEERIAQHGFGRRNFSMASKVVDLAPSKWQPYLRLMRADKPIGTWLLFWPGAWSIALAASPGHIPDLYLLSLFGAGSFLMRGAGCIVNDLYDRDFDRQVERTRLRPLASGELNSWQALQLLSGLLSASLAILLQMNWFSVALGALSLVPVATYPLFKRFTYWPQAMLGITLNWGCLLGWSAVNGSIDPSIVVPIYVAAINWTLIYDTIYAHQDKTDDLTVGVKSTAIKFGENTKPWLSCFGATLVTSLTVSGYNAGLSWPFYIGAAATASHIGWQILTVNINDPQDCWKKFSSNTYLGSIIFLSIALGNYCK